MTTSHDASKNPELDLFVSSRRAAESAIGLAMITSLLPGIEVRYLEATEITLPPTSTDSGSAAP